MKSTNQSQWHNWSTYFQCQTSFKATEIGLGNIEYHTQSFSKFCQYSDIFYWWFHCLYSFLSTGKGFKICQNQPTNIKKLCYGYVSRSRQREDKRKLTGITKVGLTSNMRPPPFSSSSSSLCKITQISIKPLIQSFYEWIYEWMNKWMNGVLGHNSAL